MKNRTFWIIVLVMAVAKLLFHGLTAVNYELHRDEMLYFSMGNHLAWGYASTPPMMAFFSFITRSLFGYQAFFVKLFPALAGAGMLVLVALFIRELGGRSIAVMTGCLAFLISTAMLRTASLFMPVIFELFFWTAILYLLLILLRTRQTRWWIGIGIFFGIAFLNKYSVLVLGASIFLGMLISRHRKLLWSVNLVYGALAALLIMLPNLIWQASHHFPVITHMGELYRTQLLYVSKATFLGEQIMMNFPALFFWFSGLLMLLFAAREKEFRLFAWIFLLVLFLFMVTRGKPYYTLGVYPAMFAFGGYFTEKYLAGKLRVLAWIAVGISVAFSILLLPLGAPVLSREPMIRYCRFVSEHISRAPMRNEQNGYYPLPQDYMDMTGWKELAELNALAYSKLDDKEKKDCVLFTNNYGQAGAIDFYGKPLGLPAPVCLNDSYVFWAPDSLKAKVFIVTDSDPGDIPKMFKTYEVAGMVKNDYFRENGLMIFLCREPMPGLLEMINQRIRSSKKIYGY